MLEEHDRITLTIYCTTYANNVTITRVFTFWIQFFRPRHWNVVISYRRVAVIVLVALVVIDYSITHSPFTVYKRVADKRMVLYSYSLVVTCRRRILITYVRDYGRIKWLLKEKKRGSNTSERLQCRKFHLPLSSHIRSFIKMSQITHTRRIIISK